LGSNELSPVRIISILSTRLVSAPRIHCFKLNVHRSWEDRFPNLALGPAHLETA
jgi:hypothetical protein